MNYQDHMRELSNGATLILSPIPQGYMILHCKYGEAEELGIVSLHEDQWAARITVKNGAFTAETLRAIADLTDQLNKETREEGAK